MAAGQPKIFALNPEGMEGALGRIGGAQEDGLAPAHGPGPPATGSFPAPLPKQTQGLNLDP